MENIARYLARMAQWERDHESMDWRERVKMGQRHAAFVVSCTLAAERASDQGCDDDADKLLDAAEQVSQSPFMPDNGDNLAGEN